VVLRLPGADRSVVFPTEPSIDHKELHPHGLA